MLSKAQIDKLTVRVRDLRAKLILQLDLLSVKDEQKIDEELEDALVCLENDSDNSDLIDLVEGLKETAEIQHLIKIIEEWIRTKQVNRQLHKNHPELAAIGFIFSPRGPSPQTMQPSDDEKIYKQQVSNDVEEQLKDSMLILYSMGFLEFKRNYEALKYAIFQGASSDELIDSALENIDNANTLPKQNPKPKPQEEEKKEEQSLEISVRKNIADKKVEFKNPPKEEMAICRIEEPTQPAVEPQLLHITKQVNPSKQLESIEQLKSQILHGRSSQSQDEKQLSYLESQFKDILRDLLSNKDNLRKSLNYQYEPSEEKIQEKLNEQLDQDDLSLVQQKIKDLQLYKKMVSKLPLYESFINEQPKQELQNLDQVIKALSSIPLLEKKLEILDLLLLEGNESLYYKALSNLNELLITKQFQEIQKPLDSLAQKRDWNQMNMILVQSYSDSQEIIKKHSSIKYFLQFTTEEKNEVINPIQLQALTKDLQKTIEQYHYLQLNIQLKEILKFFQDGNVDEAMKICNSIDEQLLINKIFQAHDLKHFKHHLELKSSLLTLFESFKFEQDFKQTQFFKSLTSAIALSCEKKFIINQFQQLFMGQDIQFNQNHFLDLIKIYKGLNDYIDIGMHPYDFVIQVINDEKNQELIKQIFEILGKEESKKQEFMNQVHQEEEIFRCLRTLFEQFLNQDQISFNIFATFIEHFPVKNQEKANKIIQEFLSFEAQLQRVLQWSNHIIVEGDKKSLYTIQDFMMINIYMDLKKLRKKICNDFKTIQRINKDELVNLLFEMIKKRLSFDQLLDKLYRDNEKTSYQITSMNLLCYLLDSCDSQLRSIVFMACSQYMPVPLIANRPQLNFSEANSEQQKLYYQYQEEENKKDIFKIGDYFQNNQKYLPRVYEELMYSFEKYKGILAFKVNTHKARSLKGCTTLTNRIFNRSFELHSSQAPIANYGQVEIQFDFNFSEPHFVPVGEVHGYLEKHELNTLLSLFNVFLIHCFKEDADEVKNIIEIIKRINQSPLVLIIQQDEKVKQSYFLEKILIQDHLIEINISSFNILERNHLKNLSRAIYQRVKKYTLQWKDYAQNVDSRIKRLQEFAEFCISFNSIHNQIFYLNNSGKTTEGYEDEEKVKIFGPRTAMKQIKKPQVDFEAKTIFIVDTANMIQEFIEQICKLKQQLKSRHVLPMNEYYSRICINENKIQRNLQIKKDEIQILRNLNEGQIAGIIGTDQSEISKKLHKMLCKNDQYVGIASVLAKFIQCIVNSILDPQFTERAQLQDQASIKGISDAKKNNLAEKIKIISDLIQKQSFSMEFLFREFYIKEKIIELSRKQNPQSVQDAVKPYKMYFQIASQQIQNGQPFELIDGDNLRFIHGVYEKIQNNYEMNEEVLVISVIGPQSSGKSLLLNTLFGTQFQSSAGRCTKGVYGCLIDIKQNNNKINGFQKLLILDTEGIQSTEKKDPGFDHKIVFYILSISHIVLVCNKGEMNIQMQEMIQIAVSSLQEFKTLVKQMPQINIIMNMIPKIEVRSLEQTYQELSQTLLEMGKDKNDLHQILNIKKENVFMLPLAFSNQGENEDLPIGKSSPEFAALTEKLNQHIFKFMNNSFQEDRNCTLNSFFRTAVQTWDMVNNYHDIHIIVIPPQVRIVIIEIQNEIEKIIFNQFQLKKQEMQQLVNEIAQLELSKYPDTSLIQRKQLFNQIDQELKKERDRITLNLINIYHQFWEKQQSKIIDDKLKIDVKKLYEDNLNKMIETNFIEWKGFINSKIQEYLGTKYNIRSNKRLQEYIEILLCLKDKIEETDAEMYFNQCWQVLIEEIILESKNIQSIKTEVFDYAYHFYRNQVKGLGPKEEDINLLDQFIKSNYINKSLIDFMEYRTSETGDDLKQDFLSFTGHRKPLEPEKFLQRQKSIGKYLEKLNYYTEVPRRELYDWNQVVIERFNFLMLENQIQSQLFIRSKGQKAEYPSKRGRLVILSIIEKIKIEGKIFQIGITQDFEELMLQIEDVYKDHYINKNKETFPRQFLTQQIDKVKNNIVTYFKYQSCSFENMRNNNQIYLYFEPNRIIKIDSSEQLFNSQFKQHRYTLFEYLQKDDIQQNYLLGIEEVRISKYELIPNRDLIKRDDKEKNDAVYNYLEQIQRAESFNIQGREKAGIEARIFFFGKLNKEKIILKIQKILLKLIGCQDNYKRENMYQFLIKQLKDTKDPSITSKFSPFDLNIFKLVVPKIQKIASKIDEELEAFCLCVSDQGIYILHQIALTLLTCIYFEIMRIYEYAPLMNFEMTKEAERKLFVAKLTSKNDVVDIQLAQKCTTCLFKMIDDKINEVQKLEYSNLIQNQSELFKFETVINDIENFILQVSVEGRDQEHEGLQRLLKGEQIQFKEQEENKSTLLMNNGNQEVIENEQLKKRGLTWPQIIQMYVDPKKFFETCFQQSWKINSDNQTENFQKSYKEKRNEILTNFISYFKMFKQLMMDRKINYSVCLFLPQGFDSKGNDDEKEIFEYCNKACAQYFSKVLRGEWDPKQSFYIENVAKLCKVEVKADPNQPFIHQDDLKNFKIEDQYKNSLVENLENQTISSLLTFVDQIISSLQNQIEFLTELPVKTLIKDQKPVMEIRSTGCCEVCPLCRRKCDMIHSQEDKNIFHTCNKTGHQILGFGGSYHKRNNYAITYGCDQLANNDIVYDEDGIQKTWEIYQSQLHQWTFKIQKNDDSNKNEKDNSQKTQKDASEIAKENNQKIWNLIGPIICKYYQLNVKDSKITFITADDQAKRMGKVETVMYLVALDCSGSMMGDKWKNVLEQSERFIKYLTDDEILKNHSKITCISYDQSSTIIFENEVPNPLLIQRIKFKGGNTNFNPPIIDAMKVAEKYLDQFQRFSFCFLSDGQAPYPQEAVDAIKKNDKLLSKFRITTVAFGDEESEIEQAAKVLYPLALDFGTKGCFKKALDPEDFYDALNEMIPNIYGIKKAE